MNFRTDIQALRGIAVLLVVFYHAHLLPIPAGYLGVDIFFLISGFLITTQIVEQLHNDSFSFKQFYVRRAWRLLPAAYTVFLFCILLTPWLLTEIEVKDFQEQVFGAISFTANIVLWSQTGYFEQAAELKPLLHTWSLSIEEQYYLVMPVLLFVMLRHKFSAFWFVSSLTSLSLALFYFSHSAMPGASFYLTPTRVWELGIGSILALYIKSSNTNADWKIANAYGYLALLLIALLCFSILPAQITNLIEKNQLHLFLITTATAVLITTRLPILNHGVIANGLSAVGTISYSLYLIHWPILAFLNSANVSGAGLWWPYRLGSVIISMALSVTLYVYIEKRFRITAKTNYRKIYPLIIASIALLTLTLSLNYLPKSKRDYKHELRINTGLSINCNKLDFFEKDECRTKESPEILLWGDSFAMHLSAALEHNQAGLIQAARSTCAPVQGLSLFDLPKFNKTVAQECIEFNEGVKKIALDKTNSIKLIILAGQWNYLLTSDTLLEKTSTFEQESKQQTFEVVRTQQKAITDSLYQLSLDLHSAGKKVVIIESPPSSGFDIGRCIERAEQKKWSISQRSCDVSRSKYAKDKDCLLYTSPSPRDKRQSRMPSSA